MSILVTGGAGIIGSNFVQRYKEQTTLVKDRPGDDRRYAIDATKIERELGWKPAQTFEASIRKPVRGYLKNQDWVSNVTNGSYRNGVEMQYA